MLIIIYIFSAIAKITEKGYLYSVAKNTFVTYGSNTIFFAALNEKPRKFEMSYDTNWGNINMHLFPYPRMEGDKVMDFYGGRYQKFYFHPYHGGLNQTISPVMLPNKSLKLIMLGKCVQVKDNLLTLGSCYDQRNQTLQTFKWFERSELNFDDEYSDDSDNFYNDEKNPVGKPKEISIEGKKIPKKKKGFFSKAASFIKKKYKNMRKSWNKSKPAENVEDEEILPSDNDMDMGNDNQEQDDDNMGNQNFGNAQRSKTTTFAPYGSQASRSRNQNSPTQNDSGADQQGNLRQNTRNEYFGKKNNPDDRNYQSGSDNTGKNTQYSNRDQDRDNNDNQNVKVNYIQGNEQQGNRDQDRNNNDNRDVKVNYIKGNEQQGNRDQDRNNDNNRNVKGNTIRGGQASNDNRRSNQNISPDEQNTPKPSSIVTGGFKMPSKFTRRN